MKKSRFSEEQIIGVLKQGEAGVKTSDLCREHGISAATFYGWKQKYGGMEVAEAQRLKSLEDENRRLKLLVMVRRKRRKRLVRDRSAEPRLTGPTRSGRWTSSSTVWRPGGWFAFSAWSMPTRASALRWRPTPASEVAA